MGLLENNETVFDLNDGTIMNLTNTTLKEPNAASGWLDVQEGFYLVGYFITPILLVIGVLGNTVTVATMASKHFAKLTSRYILIALAISDTTVLLTQPFNKLFVRRLFGFDVRALSDGGCKLFFIIFRTAKMTSSWIIVILCIERFIAVVFPHKAKRIINKKSILFLIFLDYIFIGTYNSVWTFSSIIVNGVCKPDVFDAATKEKYGNFLLIALSLYSIIPMSILIILTPTIVIKLYRKRRKIQIAANRGGISWQRDYKDIRTSVILIAVVGAFIVLVLPITTVFYIGLWRNVSAFDTNTIDFFIFREVAQLLEQVNYSINFFMYVLCSDTFRKRALNMFIRRKVGPTTQVSDTTIDPATKRPAVQYGQGPSTSNVILEMKRQSPRNMGHSMATVDI